MKRILSLALAIALLLSLVPMGMAGMTAKAALNESEGFTYEVHDGKATITGCTLENNFFMDIPATLDGYPVVSIGAQAFEDCTDLLSVTIAEGVETIGDYAFYQCYELTWLTLPDSLISIGDKAFCNCRALEQLSFGDNLKSIGQGAFSFCSSLDFYLDLPDQLESIGGAAFYDCNSLETVLLPKSLRELGAKAFAMCDRLDYIYIPDGVEKIGAQVLYGSACYHYSVNWYGDAFYMGPYLLEAKKSISGSYTTVKGITNIADGAFENCDLLTGVVLPEGLQTIGTGAFAYCDGLQSIVIPSGVTTVESEAFYMCEAVTDIQFPDSVVNLGRDVFTGTGYYNDPENWENDALYISNHLVSCKASLSGAFQVREGTKTITSGAMMGLTKLTELVLPDTLITVGNEAAAGCTALGAVTVSDSVTTIGEKAFYECSALKTLYLGREVSQIGDGAFGHCSSLESIAVHEDNKTYCSQNNALIHIQDKSLVLGCKNSQIPQDGSVTAIGAFAFEGCMGLTELTIPDAILTVGEGAFRECDALETVSLGNGVQVVGKRAFELCDVLSQVDFGQSVHTIDDFGFGFNHRLTHIEFPASLRYLGEQAFSNGTGIESISFREGLLRIGESCFFACENLTALRLPNSLKDIEEAAFSACEKITEITFGNELTAIGDAAFSGCTSLVTLTIPDSVQTIGGSAFSDCTSLRQVDLGQVSRIENSAFVFCTSLTQIHIPASVTSIELSVFAYCYAMEQMTVSPQNIYYHSKDNCIIQTMDKLLVSGCKNSIIPADGSVTKINGYSFAGCTGIKSIVVPDQVEWIGAYTFYDCSGLQEMQLPFLGTDGSLGDGYLGRIFGAPFPGRNGDFVPASLKRVVITGGSLLSNSAFSGCRSLQEIVLPETMTEIYYSPFENCQSLQKVVFPGNLQMIKDPAIFAKAPNACLYISNGQDNTVAFAKENNIRHCVGGQITFLDEAGQYIQADWYSLGKQIVAPEVPEKAVDSRCGHTLSWDSVPGTCTQNQTIQLRCTENCTGGDTPGDVTGGDTPGDVTGGDTLGDVTGGVTGDFTGDNEVNNLDVEFMLWHTLFPNSYPIQANADFNNDNEVNNLDVEYLLWHTLFPETYPV